MDELATSVHPHRVFVGRRTELATIERCVTQTRDARPSTVLIEGGAGIGKSALVARAVSELDGFAVLQAFCAADEADLPFGVIDQLVGRLPVDRLGPRPALGPGREDATPPRRVGAELLDLVAELQGDGPVAIVVDDVQWSDRASVQALGFALRRLYADQVLTVISTRTEAGSDEGAESWHSVAQPEAVVRLSLAGLDTAEVTELADRLGVGISRPFAERLRAHTDGHPLYVETVLADASLQTFSPEGQLPVPSTLAAAIRAQIAGLPPDSAVLLEAMAVLDSRAALPLVAELAGVRDAATALEPLLLARLADWFTHEPVTPVAIAHPLQRETIYATIPPTRRRALHRAAARLVDQSASWGHLVAAADRADPDLANRLEAEAAELLNRRSLDRDRAATYLIWAADLSEDRAEMERRLVEAGVLFALDNRYGRAAAIKSRIQECAPSLKRTFFLAQLTMFSGDFGTALNLFAEVMDAATESADPDQLDLQLAGEAALMLAGVFTWQGEDFAAAVGMALRSKELAPHVPANVLAATRTAAYGVALLEGHKAGLEFISKSTDLPADPARVTAEDANLLLIRGAMKLLAGDLRAAQADLNRTLHLSAESPTPQVDMEAHQWLSLTHHVVGTWEQAMLHADLGNRICLLEEVRWYAAFTSWAVAIAAAGTGDEQSATASARATRTWVELIGPAQWMCFAAHADASIAQARGDHAGMLAGVETLLEIGELPYPSSYATIFRPTIIEALLGTGSLDRADDELGRLVGLAKDVAYLRPATAWLSGWLAEARGDNAAARRAYANGIALPAIGEDSAFYRARLEQAFGRLLTAGDDHSSGVQLLRAAQERFTLMGARPYAERAAMDLAEHGVPAPRRLDGPLAALSKREREVARLVGDGMTNAETARELSVSSKTVEYHLAHIYTKLDVASRQELRTLLSR